MLRTVIMTGMMLGGLLVTTCGQAATMTEAMSAYRAGEMAVAEKALLPWAEKGVVQAQYSLGNLYTIGGDGVEMDMDKGIHWLKQAAKNGSRDAADTLGKIYTSGLGVMADQEAATFWFKRAAELASADDAECE